MSSVLPRCLELQQVVEVVWRWSSEVTGSKTWEAKMRIYLEVIIFTSELEILEQTPNAAISSPNSRLWSDGFFLNFVTKCHHLQRTLFHGQLQDWEIPPLSWGFLVKPQLTVSPLSRPGLGRHANHLPVLWRSPSQCFKWLDLTSTAPATFQMHLWTQCSCCGPCGCQPWKTVTQKPHQSQETGYCSFWKRMVDIFGVYGKPHSQTTRETDVDDGW